MISLSLGNLVLVYAGGLLVLLFLLWLGHGFLNARGRSRNHRRRIQCAHCGTLYENVTEDPLPACPQCRQRNERVAPSSV